MLPTGKNSPVKRTRIIYYIGAVSALFFIQESILAQKADGNSVPTLSALSALNVPLGVRSYGMGMAQTGNANDLSAVYYNPAGLAQINYVEYGLSYRSGANDVQGQSLLMSIPLPYGTVGLTGVFNRVQDNEYVDNGVNSLPDRNKYSYIAGISYGMPVPKLERKLNFGTTVKWFGADFGDSVAGAVYPKQQKGLFIDVGLLGTFDPAQYSEALRWLPRLSAGLAARNLHPLVKVDNEVVPIDNREEYNVGFSMHFPYKFMLNVDVVNSPKDLTRMRYGFEFWPAHFLALRGGLTKGTIEENYTSIHWGLGFGETVQNSKLSFEYSSALEFPEGVGVNFNRPHSVYHRFAFHQSFEVIGSNKGRPTPIRYTERYSHKYRFARELSPREIIADTVTTLTPEEASYDSAIQAADEKNAAPEIAPTEPETPEAPVKPNQKAKPKPKPITLGKYIVAVYPVDVEFVSGRATSYPVKEKLRGNFLIEVSKARLGRLIAANKLVSTPKQQKGELESAYLKRMQQALGADLIVFNKLYIDGNYGEMKLLTLYYKKGDSSISARTEVIGSDAEETTFVKKATEQFAKSHRMLLEELK
ncbi:MAG: hypothetical protein LDLANPLL_00729 [Turneriella sp.]|nr:hypothetical protein [Turneriella sp.]